MKSFFLTIVLLTLFTMTAFSLEEIDRTKRPAAQPARAITLPKIQKATLSNGLNVWLVEQHKLPTFAFNLLIQAGSDHDPVSMPGLASMTADVIDEGTTTRDALAISDEVESIGANFNVNTSIDGTFLMLSSLTKHLDKAMDLFTDVLTHPTFPEKEFDRLKKQRITDLLRQKDQPSMIANTAFSYLLYGSNHPYGNNAGGTDQSLNSMTRDDLLKFYQQYYVPNNATLIVVGDLKLSEIVPKLESALAGWKSGTVPALTLNPPPPIEKFRLYLVDKPEAAQSEIRLGYPALARSTPDFFPIAVMNRILGGQFSSRINWNLREQHGFTYGARSSFSFYKNPGPFMASAPVNSGQTDSALFQLLHEINLMKEKGMTEDELKVSKSGIIGGFTLSFETPAQIAGSMVNVILYGLPEEYYSNYVQNIDNVSLADIQRVSGAYLDASKMIVLIVGDIQKIKPGLAGLNLGDIVECDLDGRPK